ncbi:MAG: MATE family efflux transporter [Bauldia sp.]|uniref:MATE family efflux transporter n=1 Tax=Bauldia sp. TaxID=2575872 RepID=UPI001DB77E5D|nr:MATE family efflux transporter [Bauldia sp.]MCB1497768.1 MATE family efflux transporter [Bauldia sp.]
MSSSVAGAPPKKARFVTGSTMRHVLVMAAAGAAGLVAVFVVDFLNLFYISLLHDPGLTAAVGYASALIYVYTSLTIGVMIAATALVARALGAEDRSHAREVAGSAVFWMIVVSGGSALLTMPFVNPLLTLIGAAGEAHSVAAVFMWIVLPTTPLLGLGMCFVGLLRAVGDARQSMVATLAYGAAILILDPLLILGVGWGVPGAAIASVLARLVMVGYALRVLIVKHDLIARPTIVHALRDFRPLAAIGIPAILTNIATPVGVGYATSAIAPYGDQAVAGWTVVSRLLPVAFGGLFALSGAVGPIFAQNYGAGAYDRVRATLGNAITVAGVYSIVVSAILFLIQHWIVIAFHLEGNGAVLLTDFSTYFAITFAFAGGLFVGNAAFNNLGHARLSTLFNWGRAIVGTVPFVLAGQYLYGMQGVLAGYFVGGIPFGIAGVLVAYRIIDRLGDRPARSPEDTRPAMAGGPGSGGDDSVLGK